MFQHVSTAWPGAFEIMKELCTRVLSICASWKVRTKNCWFESTVNSDQIDQNCLFVSVNRDTKCEHYSWSRIYSCPEFRWQPRPLRRWQPKWRVWIGTFDQFRKCWGSVTVSMQIPTLSIYAAHAQIVMQETRPWGWWSRSPSCRWRTSQFRTSASVTRRLKVLSRAVRADISASAKGLRSDSQLFAFPFGTRKKVRTVGGKQCHLIFTMSIWNLLCVQLSSCDFILLCRSSANGWSNRFILD